MTVTLEEVDAELARRRERIDAILAAREHPAGLLRHVRMPDTRAVAGFEAGGEEEEEVVGTFRFELEDEASGWFWQRGLLEWWLEHPRTIVLKARQLGVTWLAGGLGLWLLLYRPGSLVLIYRQKEGDAIRIVDRVWDMLGSVPRWLWNGAEVMSPSRGARPSQTGIKLRFPGGRVSTMLPMSSAEASGHGETAALVVMDEFAYNDYASDLMRAVNPAAGSKGKVVIISTANGVSDPETGEGSYFHYLWVNEDTGFRKRFLSWRAHPERDDEWYANSPETRAMRWWERQAQYPNNELEAFASPDKVWFDRDALLWYANEATGQLLYRMEFERRSPSSAARVRCQDGRVAVFEEPRPDREYAVGADVATGTGVDYSAAYVIDLSSMALVAEFHGRLDADLYAYQLHFLGRWYNTARVAVERGGGYGEPVIVNLRDGKDGRPAYPRLFRYREESRADSPERKQYGFPMTQATRPKVLNAMERAVRERLLPFMPPGLLHECNTFVNDEKRRPSPRAQAGARDDRVMAAALALEMYRLYGAHPDQRRRKPSRPKPHWLRLGNPQKKVAA